MSNDIKTLSVTILDREYRVACPPGAEEELRRSASFLDNKMQEIKASGKVLGIERIAVMAALNLTHELLLNSDGNGPDHTQVNRMISNIDSILNQSNGLEF